MKLGPLKTAIRNFSGTVSARWESSLFVVQPTAPLGFAKTMLIAFLDEAYGKDNKVETGLTLTEDGFLHRVEPGGSTSYIGRPEDA